jgi:tRNA(Ile)-lysidine synthase
MIDDSFIRTIQRFKLIEKRDSVLIGVSGGPDSMTLLHLLRKLQTSWKLNLAIGHVNHQLRGKTSDQDEAFVRHLGHKLKIPVFGTRVRVSNKAKKKKMSVEEAARDARYHFFDTTAETRGFKKIAVAHTQDDQAETVLMRVISGTGLQGLQAIRPKRKLGEAYVVRPLIEISRKEVMSFVRAQKIRFRKDKSNQMATFLRNRIRLKLIPFLESSFNPQVKRALARLPHLLDVDLSFLDETADLFYKRLAIHKQQGEIYFPKQSFLQLRPSIQYRLLSRAIRALSDADLDFDHWNSFLEHVLTERRSKVQLPKKLIASISPESIRVRCSDSKPVDFKHLISPGKALFIPEINLTVLCEKVRQNPRPLRKSDVSFEVLDGDKLVFPLMLTNRKTGDRFQPLGQKRALKLKGYFINKQIPQEDRDRLPIARSQGRIAWIGGVSMAEPFKVSTRTTYFIRLSVKPGNFV